MVTLIREIISFHEIFIKNKGIGLIENQNLNNTLKIISLHKETHDSFLVSQALEGNASYFISRDTRLKDSLKVLDKIKIVTPKDFFKSILNTEKIDVSRNTPLNGPFNTEFSKTKEI